MDRKSLIVGILVGIVLVSCMAAYMEKAIGDSGRFILLDRDPDALTVFDSGSGTINFWSSDGTVTVYEFYMTQ